MSDNSAFARADRRETNANCCSGRTFPTGGARRDRTDDLLLAKQALSQLSYGPDVGAAWKLVGLGRFELPTSRLSSARSNQLSYKPGDPTDRAGSLQQRDCERNRTRKSAARARPGRKRSVDGGVPPVGLMTEPLMFLSDPIEVRGCEPLKDHP